MKYPNELIGVRGLAAAYVLFRHALTSLPPSFVGHLVDNTYGVKLFMIVSGFSIYWLLASRKPTYGRFVVGRFFRVFPVYLVGVIVYALMLDFVLQTFQAAPTSPLNENRLMLVHEARSHLLPHFLAHLTLLHGLIPHNVLAFSSWTILAQAWSLTIEWQLYLVAPFLIGWLSRIDRLRSQIALLGFVAVSAVLGHWLSAGFLGNNLAMFSVGLMSYMLADRASELGPGVVRGCLIAMLALTAVWDPNSLPPVIVWLTTLYAILMADHNIVTESISRFLRSRPLAFLGRISYSFYIFHMTSLFICLRVIDRLGTPAGLRYVLLPATSFALATLFAIVAYHLIERPFHRLGKSLTTGQKLSLLARPKALEGAPLSA